MAYLVVLLISVLVGAGVYAATLRSGRAGPVAIGFHGLGEETYEEVDPTFEAAPGYTYLRVATRGPSWRDRVLGFVGLIVLVGVSAAALAFGIYQLGHIINVTIEKFLAG